MATETKTLKGLKIFEAGVYPQGNFTEEDVALIAKNYNPSIHEAPNYVDHPDEKGNRPFNGLAFGWIERVYAKGKELFADIKQVPQQFMDWVESGQVKKRSVEIYPDFQGKGPYLRALAWPMIPQVKGMPDPAKGVNFAGQQDEVYVIDFEEATYQPGDLQQAVEVSELTQKMRDALFKFSDMAHGIITNSDTLSGKRASIQKLIDELKQLDIFKESSNMSEPDKNKPVEQPKTFSEADVQTIVNKAVADATSKLTETLTSKFGELKNGIELELQKKQIETDVRSFCDQMVTAKKLSPGERATEEATLVSLKFSELGQKPVEGQKPVSEQRMDAIRNRSEATYLFSEIDKGTAQTDRTAKAREIASQAVATFNEHNMSRHTDLGAFKAQMFRDQGLSEIEIASLPDDVFSKAERAQAGF